MSINSVLLILDGCGRLPHGTIDPDLLHGLLLLSIPPRSHDGGDVGTSEVYGFPLDVPCLLMIQLCDRGVPFLQRLVVLGQ